MTNGERWSFYYLQKVYGANEDGEETVVGINRYDLVNLEARDRDGNSRIMGGIRKRFD